MPTHWIRDEVVASAADPGDDLEPAKAVGLRTGRTTMITHSRVGPDIPDTSRKVVRHQLSPASRIRSFGSVGMMAVGFGVIAAVGKYVFEAVEWPRRPMSQPIYRLFGTMLTQATTRGCRLPVREGSIGTARRLLLCGS